MKENLSQDGFEDFLKKSSDRLQMRPSDKVWAAISADLHRKRRRAGWLASFLILALSSVGYLVYQEAGDNGTANNTLAGTTAGSNNKLPRKAAAAPSQAVSSPDAEPGITPEPALSNRGEANPLRIAYVARNRSITNTAPGHPVNLTAISNRNNVPVAPTSDVQEGNAGVNGTAGTTAVTAIAEAAVNNNFQATIIDSDPEAIQVDAENKSMVNAALVEPATIESVVNQVIPRSKARKFEFQLNFTPTISYRKLSRNENYVPVAPQNGLTPDQQPLTNVNDAVVHKPSMGLEAGFSVHYPAAQRLRVQAGMQFIVSRYDIKAFTSNTEPASVAYRNGGARISATNYRNYGYGDMQTDWLQNMYFQVSAPVGVNYRFKSRGKLQFGVAGTIQPSYMISERAYLLSTDYKNYVEVPWLVRRWNVGTAVETFVSYSSGKLNWQIGPQVRYQVLSSFITNYPVKENLLDFGLKFGVSLNK